MTTITAEKMNTVAGDLKSIIKQAQRRLFEFETMASLYELSQGKFKTYKSAAALIRDVKRSR